MNSFWSPVGKRWNSKLYCWHKKFKHVFWHWQNAAPQVQRFHGHMEERSIVTGGELFWAINTYNPTLSAFHQGCQGAQSATLQVPWSSTRPWLKAVARHFGGHMKSRHCSLKFMSERQPLFIICDSQQLTSLGNKLNSHSAHYHSACVWLPGLCWLEHQFLLWTFPVLFSVGDAAFCSCCSTKKWWCTGISQWQCNLSL